MKKTLVIGASTNPLRVSNDAVRRLTTQGHETIAIGIKEGEIGATKILTGRPKIDDLDTITLYINPRIQKDYYDYILLLQPKRIIFNPGTENYELMKMAREAGIEVDAACTLVMLSIGHY